MVQKTIYFLSSAKFLSQRSKTKNGMKEQRQVQGISLEEKQEKYLWEYCQRNNRGMTYLRPGRGSIRKYLQKERKGQSQKQKDMIISILRLADNHEVNINQSRLKPSLQIIIIVVISASSQLNIFLVKDFSFKFLEQKFLRIKIA